MSFYSIQEDQKTAFGELLVADPSASVQIQFPYNINTDLVEKRENASGSVTQADSMAVVQSGASANSAAHMLSKGVLKYAPGQGALVRFTALFTTGVANSTQLVGIGEVGDGLFFGFNGNTFSILRRELGVPEIQTLTISAGAGTASGNITINLDGVSKVVAVVQTDTAREVAVKIADADFSDTGLGWSATVHNATVIFKAWSDGNKAGAFSLDDSADTTGVAGTFAETVAGVSTTNEWVAQTSWNVDTFDGNGPSGITLDSTKGNVFQIRYQWLGFGLITFSIEDPDDGDCHTVHQIRFGNANTLPSLQNPTLPLHIMSKNTSNTSNLTIKTASMAGFVEGPQIDTALLNGESKNFVTVAATEIPILSLKNNLVYQSKENRAEIRPEFVALATEASKPIIFRVRLLPTLTGTPAFTDVDSNVSIASIDTAAVGVTGGRDVFTTILGKADSEIINFHDLNKKMRPGEFICITAEATSGTGQEVTVSITWSELF